MPVVNATDVPLTPYPTGRTSPQAPSDYQNIQATPAEFGAQFAEAQSGVGKTLEQVGTNLINRAVAQQHFLNKTEEDKLSSQLDDELHKQKFGDPTAGVDPITGQPLVPGFKNRYGSDAIDYIKSGQPTKDFNDAVARISASASNDQVREMFMRQSRSRRAAFDNSLDEHWTSQLAAHADDVRKAVNIGINRDLAAGYNDDQVVQSKVHDKIALYVRDEKDPIVAGGKYFLAVHDAAKELIDAALANNDTRRASEIFNAYKGHMSGSDQISLWNSIKGPLDQQLTTGAGLRALGGGGGGPGAAVIPYTPATDILSGTGMNADQYQTFRSHVAAREKGPQGYATPPNAGGYSGMYQLGRNEIRETAGRLDVPVPSQQQFLGDPQLQERFFENYTLDHHNSLMQQSEKYRNASPAERAGILMGAHLGGVGGVTTYLEGRGDPADSNGTRVSDYVSSMGRAMAGGGAAPAGAPAAAPGAAAAAAQPGAIEVRGDSLGVGLRSRLKAGGNAVVSAQPDAILADIKKEPENHWEGQTVVLASGSNGNKMPVVEETIKYLQDHKANVVVVGYGSKFPAKNAMLTEMATRLKVPVIDAEDVDPGEGVHPSPRGYQSMADKIRAQAGGTASAAKPPGLVEPGNITPTPPPT